jgi:hypothetical protein
MSYPMLVPVDNPGTIQILSLLVHLLFRPIQVTLANQLPILIYLTVCLPHLIFPLLLFIVPRPM